MSHSEEILNKAHVLILSRLQERTSIEIPAIGVFRPIFHMEYILEGEEGRVLIPPHISLSYQPAEYLLDARHYTTLDPQPPNDYFTSDFISNLSDLHGWDEGEVSLTLSSELKEVLEGLFKGRRVTLLGIGDLFVTEEVAGVLLLNFIPNPTLTQSLNAPFSVYSETKLRADIDFPEIEVRQNRPIDDVVLQYAIAQQLPAPVPATETEIIPEVVPMVAPVQIEKKSSKARWLWLGLALVIIVGAYILYPKRQVRPPMAPIESPTVLEDTTVTDQPIAPLAPLDTIAVPKGGSLAAVAREYYDNALFWVYVYIANVDSIPDPDNLRPGQTLIVPPLEWYHLKSDPDEANKEAKAWATIILNRRFTSYEEQRPQLNIHP